MKRAIALFAVAAAWLAASCSSDEIARTTTPESSTAAPIETVSDTTTDVSATSGIPTASPPVTATSTTATSHPPVTATSTTATSHPPVTATSTATTTVVPRCDLDEAVAILDSVVPMARLESGGTWETGIGSPAFGDRTNTADEYTARVAYACGERFVQFTPAGAERLALVAWNDLRHAVVLQATDPPTQPYRTDVVFQLYLEQPYGEWLDDQFVWAATMEAGESIVIATHDYSAAITAKSWQSSVPRFDDLPVTLDAEQFAIDALIAVGARNVSVAEPASTGYPIGTIQFNTPLALAAVAVIAQAGEFDPMVPIVPDGESDFADVAGVDVRLTVGKELGRFDLYETGWSCGDHEWRLYTGLGSPEELAEFTESLVRSLPC